MDSAQSPAVVRFGPFELDLGREVLRRNGVVVRLQPQPYRLLALLVTKAGHVATRDEIRQALWDQETFVDFDQGVNFTVRQVRAALGDDAERPLFVETVPRRGYRFIAPIDVPADQGVTARVAPVRLGDTGLQKALWANILELRLAAERRRRLVTIAAILAALLVAVAAVSWLLVG